LFIQPEYITQEQLEGQLPNFENAIKYWQKALDI
jgi:hypothetical protein